MLFAWGLLQSLNPCLPSFSYTKKHESMSIFLTQKITESMSIFLFLHQHETGILDERFRHDHCGVGIEITRCSVTHICCKNKKCGTPPQIAEPRLLAGVKVFHYSPGESPRDGDRRYKLPV